LDVKVLEALRNPADPSKPIGPDWLPYFVVDLTALGGFPVLSLVVAVVVGFLLLQTRYHTAWFVAATAISGELFNFILKHTFNRARPTVIPNMTILSPSFPSGHAMESAIVYLTLGAVLMRVAERRATKMYVFGVAILLTVIVGLSRVYLGVHYPTDVIGGWTVGFMWASVCWLVAQRFERRTIEQERSKAE
jgi:undecaprenyl-diphosphatase